MSGELKPGQRPRSPTLSTVRPGGYFGEVSLLTGSLSTAQAGVREESRLIVIGGDALREVLAGQPALVERDPVGKKAPEGEEPSGARPTVHHLLERIRAFFELEEEIAGGRGGSGNRRTREGAARLRGFISVQILFV